MKVDPDTAKHRHTYKGRHDYFCSAECDEKFAANPAQYLKKEPRQNEPVPAGTIYTCPMHPEIRAARSRSMPHLRHGARAGAGVRQCGPQSRARRYVQPVLDRPRAHRTGVRTGDGRTPDGTTSMARPSRHRTGSSSCWRHRSSYGRWPFFERAWTSLKTRNLNMFTLIAMGTGVAWVYSIVGTLLPGVFPAAMRGHDGSVAVYFVGGSRHHRSRFAWTGSGAESPRTDERRHSGASRTYPRKWRAGSNLMPRMRM